MPAMVPNRVATNGTVGADSPRVADAQASRFGLILPFLEPIRHLIEDDGISEIMVNGGRRVFIERDGLLQEAPGIVIEERQLLTGLKIIARSLGDEISEEKPILDSRLPDGSRVAAVLPPCSVDGISLTIRKFDTRHFTMADLIERGSVPRQAADLLRDRIARRQNILISGGTGTGKTTLLGILAAAIPDDDRIVLIEDTAEIHAAKPNLVRFEARREQMGLPAVAIRDLVRASLRHRPDRLIVGEIRGEEAYDLLQALNTGHAGSLSTIHANSARQALTRLRSCILQAGLDIPHRALQTQIADSIQVIVHLERAAGRRRVAEIVELAGFDAESDRHQFNPLYQCA
ncbi:MAG: CpaF family protein [Terriglobales bacterium]